VPTHFPTAVPGVLYSPRNYDGRFRGPLRARLALAGSENVPAVWLVHELGVPELLGLLRRAGLTTLDKSADHYGVALTMGDAEVRLDELVGAYAMLARGGVHATPRLVRSFDTAEGPLSPPAVERLLSERAAWWVADVLSDDEARAWAFGAGSVLDFPFPVAVKTGTSQSYHDNWTLGFTTDVTVGVWVGNFDRTPLRQAPGAVGAGPLFHDVLLAAQRAVAGRLPADAEGAPVPRPLDLVEHPVCDLSGLGAGPACPVRHAEWLAEAALPAACDWHRGSAAGADVRLPNRYAAWATPLQEPAGAAVSLKRSSEGEATRDLAEAGDAIAPRIVSPPDGASYLLDPTLRPGFQSVPLRAVAPAGGSLAWSVDGVPLGLSHSGSPLDWPLTPGRHAIVVSDSEGRVAQAAIQVR
jgi:penicillin-binding protein 1C